MPSPSRFRRVTALVLSPVRGALRRAAGLWARIRAWRRIKFTRAGAVFTLGAFTVGFAAINTGNNLLYLLLGAMLGLVAVSGWLSEQVIRDLRLERWVPRGVPVDQEVRIVYRVRNRKRWLPTMAVEITEEGLSEPAFLAKVPPSGEARARSVNRFIRRGIYPLDTVTLSTTFPFGLFLKERDVRHPGELVIWPRTDLPVRAPMSGAGRKMVRGAAFMGSAGLRGEYRGLREYRPGDDPRDIHWRSSARLVNPVVREYERDASETLWICLDLGGERDDQGEHLVETAASLAARAAREGKRFALVAGEYLLWPGSGPGHLERVLDALARVDFHPLAPAPIPPVDPAACVLVSRTGRQRTLYSDALVGGRGAAEPPTGRAS